jgi:hypothetical protein
MLGLRGKVAQHFLVASKDTQTINKFEHAVRQDSYNLGNVTLH